MLHTKQPGGGDDMFEKTDASKHKEGRGLITEEGAYSAWKLAREAHSTGTSSISSGEEYLSAV